MSTKFVMCEKAVNRVCGFVKNFVKMVEILYSCAFEGCGKLGGKCG